MSYKWCTVPLCKSNSEVTPGKLFIQVPMNAGTRAKWFKLARREATLSPRTYFCEDHFDLPNDMVNYTRYTTMGSVGRIQLKPGCMPSIFDYEVDQKIQIAQDATHTPVLKRKRLSLIHEVENQWQVDQTPDEPQPGPSIDDSTSNIVSPHLSEYSKPETVSVATQVYMTSTFQNKGTQTSNINMRAVATSPSDVCSLCLEKSNSVLNPLTAVSQLESIYYKNILASDRTDYSDFHLSACDKCLQQLSSYQNFIITCQSSYEFIMNKSCLNEEQEEVIIKKEEVITKEEQHDIHSGIDVSDDNDCEETKEMEHTGNDLLKCSFCDIRVKRKCHLKDHERTHTGERPYVCSICNTMFTRRGGLNRHMKKHERTYTGERQYVKNKSCLKEEQEVIIKEKKQEVVIKEDKEGLIIKEAEHDFHSEIDDSDENDCEETKETGRTGNTLLKCSFCDIRVKRKCHLKDHERTHTGERPYVCSICNKMFTRRGGLNRHMKKHTGGMEKCEICEKTFCTQSDLRVHMRIHTGETPYKCSFCDKAFRTISIYKYHMATHTGERSFICKHCGLALKRKGDLTRHQEIHMDTPLLCQLCDSTFLLSSSLKRHVKNCHS